MPDSKLRELAIEALTKFNAKKPSHLEKTKDVVTVLSGLLASSVALISVIGFVQQTHRANVAQAQKNTVQMTATAGLQTAQNQINGLVRDLRTVPPQGDVGAIDSAITRANSISETLTNTQSQILTPAVEPSTAQPTQSEGFAKFGVQEADNRWSQRLFALAGDDRTSKPKPGDTATTLGPEPVNIRSGPPTESSGGLEYKRIIGELSIGTTVRIREVKTFYRPREREMHFWISFEPAQ